jgi:glutamate--cysteine ligase
MASKKLSVQTASAYLLEHHFTPSAGSISCGPPGLVGIELETYPYQKLQNKIHPAEDPDQLFEIIRREVVHISRIDKVDVVSKKIFYQNWDSIQFEPGGQTELITGPVGTLNELSGRIRALKQLVKEAGTLLNLNFGQYGMQPWFKQSDIELRIKNDRYQNLIAYFDSLSPYGRRMMLESSSLQICLDLGNSTQQAVRRIVLANFLVPFTTALFANSPNNADAPSPFRSYRYHIWQNLDPLRSGTSYAKAFNPRTTLAEIVEAYLRFALKAPAIGLVKSTETPLRHIPFGVWLQDGFKGSFPDLEDLKHHLSLLFPDVRIRKFMEIRSIDVPPEGWEFVPICFYCGILYDDRALEEALEMVFPHRHSEEDFLKQSVFGLQSDVLYEMSKKLFRIAMDGYSRLPDSFKVKEAAADRFEEYFHQFTLKRKTFADMKTDLFG